MKKKPLSQEQKDNISKKLTGRKLPAHVIEKLKGRIPVNKGKKGLWKSNRKGKKFPNHHSISYRKLLSEKMRGEKNLAWRGGTSKIGKIVRRCMYYQIWRTSVFTRDSHTCQECKVTGGYLNADHIRPFAVILHENNIKTIEQAIECLELWDINNGRTLCLPCHKKTETFGRNTFIRNKIQK